MIRAITSLIRIRKGDGDVAPGDVGTYGEVGVNSDMVVKIFNLLMELRNTAVQN